MTHPIAALSDEQLMHELLRYAPENGKAGLHAEFSEAVYRYRAALEEIPVGGPDSRLLDVGAHLYMAAIYVNLLQYGRASVATKWKTFLDDELLRSTIPNGEKISIEQFDAEAERFPYPDQAFDVVVCTEVIEHLAVDPMHMLAEMNRVVRDGGSLVMTTPNAASFSALKGIMAGQHPYSWSQYSGESTDRHNREYTINELERLVSAAGFDVAHSETVSAAPFGLKDRLLATWISLPDLVRGRRGLGLERMHWTSLVIGRKVAPVRDRRPAWLYYSPQDSR